jgi:hypothetical protein
MGKRKSIEVTDKMVHAGVKVLHESGLVKYPSLSDGLVVKEIFEEMLSESEHLVPPENLSARS